MCAGENPGSCAPGFSIFCRGVWISTVKSVKVSSNTTSLVHARNAKARPAAIVATSRQMEHIRSMTSRSAKDAGLSCHHIDARQTVVMLVECLVMSISRNETHENTPFALSLRKLLLELHDGIFDGVIYECEKMAIESARRNASLEYHGGY